MKTSNKQNETMNFNQDGSNLGLESICSSKSVHVLGGEWGFYSLRLLFENKNVHVRNFRVALEHELLTLSKLKLILLKH